MAVESTLKSTEIDNGESSRQVTIAVALLSASGLGYEIILLKLLSYGVGHHFASMAISLALLGIGASGTFLTLFRKRLTERFPFWMPAGAAGFSLSVLLCPFAAFRLGFLPDSFMWDYWQIIRLAALYGILSVPFFFSGGCVGLALAVRRKSLDHIYRADLLGAGIGGAVVLASLSLLHPETALKAVSISGIAATALLLRDTFRKFRFLTPGAVLISGIMLSILPNATLSPHLSLYKPLNKALLMPGASIAAETTGLWGKNSAVTSPEIPLRYAPGMSLSSTTEPPEQMALFTDGESSGIITRFNGSFVPLAFFNDLPTALPYLLFDRPSVLVLKAGGGFPVLEALYHKARRVEAVEPNSDLNRTVDTLDEFTGGIFKEPKINRSALSPRTFLGRSEERFDIIIIPQIEGGGRIRPVTENYLMTTEGIAVMLNRLTPNGILMTTVPLEVPDRAGFKVLATVTAAIGDQDNFPGRTLAGVLSPTTFTLLVAKSPLTEAQIHIMQRYCTKRGFSLVLPGVSPQATHSEDATRYATVFDTLLGPQRTQFIRDYALDVAPPTDDRPFFNVFIKTKHMDTLLPLLKLGAMSLVDWGWILLLFTLGIAICYSTLFIIFPLLPIGRHALVEHGKLWTFFYFSFLGFAFMFLEMVSIKKLAFCLGNPVVAAGTIISAFLIFAGLGAGVSRKLCPESGTIALGIQIAVGGIIISGSTLLLLLPTLQLWLPRFPIHTQYILGALAFSPTAFFMGMPFPLGLRLLSHWSPDLIPWAWAVNGCASVVSPLLALVLAVNFGYLATAIMAAGLYLLATLAVMSKSWLNAMEA